MRDRFKKTVWQINSGDVCHPGTGLVGGADPVDYMLTQLLLMNIFFRYDFAANTQRVGIE